jgi:hypothetical protein
MASTLLNEQQSWHPDAIERQLAHASRNKVRAACNYAEHLPVRRRMMQAWADYLDELREAARARKSKRRRMDPALSIVEDSVALRLENTRCSNLDTFCLPRRANSRHTATGSKKMEDRVTQPMAVHVVGVKIPFIELVVLLVKFALALIPALFIIYAVSALFWAVLGGLFGHHGQTTSM